MGCPASATCWIIGVFIDSDDKRKKLFFEVLLFKVEFVALCQWPIQLVHVFVCFVLFFVILDVFLLLLFDWLDYYVACFGCSASRVTPPFIQ